MRISRLQGKVPIDGQDTIIQERLSTSPISTASRESLSSSPLPQPFFLVPVPFRTVSRVFLLWSGFPVIIPFIWVVSQ